jgi:hypothetical protein
MLLGNNDLNASAVTPEPSGFPDGDNFQMLDMFNVV